MSKRFALSLLGLAAFALLPAVSLAAPPNAPLPALDVQPLPGTPFARVMAAHQAEAEVFRQRAQPLPQPLWYSAADFAALAGNPWTIVHQDITVDVDAALTTLMSDIVVTVRAHKAGIADLGFVSPLAQAISTTAAEGAEIKSEFVPIQGDLGFLTLHLPQALEPEADTKLHVSRTAKLDCGAQGLGLLSCIFDKTFSAVVLYEYALRASDFSHSPFASDLHVVTPADKMAAAPGLPSGPDKLADGRLVWHFKQIETTDNAGFSIAAYKPMVTPAAGGLPNVRIFAVPPDSGAAQETTDLVLGILNYYAQHFVPFPWKELNVIELSGNFGGGYAPLSAAFLTADAMGLSATDFMWESMAELISHEIAHQWWGNLVSPAGGADVALSEAMAEYSSCAYTEKQFGDRRQIVRNNISYVYTVTPVDDKPVGSSGVYNSSKYQQIVYFKGSVVFDMLRRELGEDVMDAGLKEYVKQFGHDYARIADMRAAMEKASGRDLGYFFAQWFGRPGAIRAELSSRIVPDGAGWKVRVRIRQVDEQPRRFKLKVTVDFQQDPSQDFVQDIVPDQDGVTFVELAVAKHPVRVRVDPDRLLLRAFARGTPGDPNLTGLCDGADLVDLALRSGRRIMAQHQGQNFFVPDTRWNELYDLTSDYQLSPADATELELWLGTEAEAF